MDPPVIIRKRGSIKMVGVAIALFAIAILLVLNAIASLSLASCIGFGIAAVWGLIGFVSFTLQNWPGRVALELRETGIMYRNIRRILLAWSEIAELGVIPGSGNKAIGIRFCDGSHYQSEFVQKARRPILASGKLADLRIWCDDCDMPAPDIVLRATAMMLSFHSSERS